MPDTRHRVAVQFDEETYEQIRTVAFRSRKSIPEIIRSCVEAQLTVEAVTDKLRTMAVAPESESALPKLIYAHVTPAPASKPKESKEGGE